MHKMDLLKPLHTFKHIRKMQYLYNSTKLQRQYLVWPFFPSLQAELLFFNQSVSTTPLVWRAFFGCGLPFVRRNTNFTISNTYRSRRFIILNVWSLCLASIYGPNVDDPSFLHSFFPSLSDHWHRLIIGGDFNLDLIQKLTRSVQQEINILKTFMQLYTHHRLIPPMLTLQNFLTI